LRSILRCPPFLSEQIFKNVVEHLISKLITLVEEKLKKIYRKRYEIIYDLIGGYLSLHEMLILDFPCHAILYTYPGELNPLKIKAF
jgi:hypothetical protein